MNSIYAEVNQRRSPGAKDSRWPWSREILAWLLSSLLLVCIIITLSVYHNKPQPVLRGGITLNALIAVITKAGLLLLVVPLSAAFGQWKWLRVRTARSLKEFAAISDAAQNPWASLLLLLRFRGGLVAAIGALLVLCTQVIETFVQQSVKYPVIAQATDAQATLPISNYFHSLEPITGFDAPPDPTLKAAVYNGLFATAPNTASLVSPSCDGVNCTWSSYSSLGFCSACTNITDQVQTKKESTRYALPGGLLLAIRSADDDPSSHYYNATITGASSIDELSNSQDQAVSDDDHSLEMTFLAVWQEQSVETSPGLITGTTSLRPTAGKCTFNLCIQSFDSAKYSILGLEETRSSAEPIGLTLNGPSSSLDSDLNFSADLQSWTGFAYWLKSLLGGSYNALNAFGETFEARTDSRDAVFQVLIGGRGNLTLPSLFDNVADSITHAMRATNPRPDTEAAPTVAGTSYENQTIVRVDWGWLAFPFAIWLLVLLYLLAVMFWSRDDETVWKDHIVATLCHGLEADTLEEVAVLSGVKAMETKAKELRVKLGGDRGEHGRRLVRAGSPMAMNPI